MDRKEPTLKAKRHLVRGEPIVQKVLDAALAELSRVGYAAMRIEDVAARAGVNKTTVYRRWPTKGVLVRAVLLSMFEHKGVDELPDLGSVREDLIANARRFIAVLKSPEGRSIHRLLAAEHTDSELRKIVLSIQDAHGAVPRAILARARRRGELKSSTDPDFFFDTLCAACDRQMMQAKPVDMRFVVRVIDLLLEGALKRPKARSH